MACERSYCPLSKRRALNRRNVLFTLRMRRAFKGRGNALLIAFFKAFETESRFPPTFQRVNSVFTTIQCGKRWRFKQGARTNSSLGSRCQSPSAFINPCQSQSGFTDPSSSIRVNPKPGLQGCNPESSPGKRKLSVCIVFLGDEN